jgi:Tfp pilus assembly protein PilV
MNTDHEERESDESCQKGFGVIEVLFGILLIGISSLAVTSEIMMSLKTGLLLESSYAAHSLAIQRAEQISAMNISNITAADSGTETGLTFPGVSSTFTRATNITVNTDNSRSLEIIVTRNGNIIPTSVTYHTTYSTWQ